MRFSSRRFSPRLAIAFAALLFAVAALWSTPARAQAVTLNATAVTRDLPLPGRNLYNWANFADCEGNLHLTFPLVLDAVSTSNSSYLLVAYAGADGATCTDLATRNAPGTSTQTCWPLTGSSITKSQTVNAVLALRDIISQYGEGTKGAYAGPYGEDRCHAVTSSGPTAINVWFFLIDGGSGNLAGTAAQFPLSIDLVGPAPPTSLSAGIADTALIINWSPSGDTDTQGYNVYVDPPPNGQTAPDASTTVVDSGTSTEIVCADGGFTDGGVDDQGNPILGIAIDGGCQTVTVSSTTTSAGSTCPSTVLVPIVGTTTSVNEAGQSVSAGSQSIPSAYLSSSPGSLTSTSANVTGLNNGTYYTVAVSGIDNYGNTGILSTPACNTPEPVTDFWGEYRNAGGLAGGGFCSIDGAGASSVFTPLLVFGGWALVTVIRRRRKKQ